MEKCFAKRQRGQSAVEFALMAPIVFLMIFVMIYGGLMFMEYFHLSNDARTVARRVAVTTSAEEQRSLMDYYSGDYKDFPLYNVKRNVGYDDETAPVDVVVTVTFTRARAYLILPERFTMTYRMKIENPPKTNNS